VSQFQLPKIDTNQAGASEAYGGEGSIQILEGLEAVRKRPACTSVTRRTGLHHLVFEVVDNSIDESLAGHCDDIVVTIHTDSISVATAGDREVDVKARAKRSAAEIALTELHAGGNSTRTATRCRAVCMVSSAA
jgi:DNA gyrase subunit B